MIPINNKDKTRILDKIMQLGGSFFRTRSQYESKIADTSTSISDLSPELLQTILSNLEFEDLLNSSLVNTTFNQLTGLNYLTGLLKGLNLGVNLTSENTGNIASDKASFYAWLRGSPSGPLRIKILTYLYLLENPNAISVNKVTHTFIYPSSFMELTTTPFKYMLDLAYNVNNLKHWIRRNNFPLSEQEVNLLARRDTLNLDVSKLRKYNYLMFNENSITRNFKSKFEEYKNVINDVKIPFLPSLLLASILTFLLITTIIRIIKLFQNKE
jgi:hypothetical protein